MIHSATLDDVVMYSLKVHGGGLTLAPGFKLTEFASRCGCDQVLVHPWLLEGLVMLREEFGQTVRINSSYRTVKHNAAIGGADGSKHKLGMAADVDVMNVKPKTVADWAESEGFGGVGRYNTFTHLDCWGKNRRWKA